VVPPVRRLSVRFLIAIAVAALGASPPLRAHDLWIAPSSFTPALGEPIRLHLVLASGETTEVLPRSDASIVRFAVRGPAGDQAVAGLDGTDPAGFLRPAAPGWYTVLYESSPSFATLSPEVFRAYLLEKGLDPGALRAGTGNTSADTSGAAVPAAGGAAEPTTELFRRSIKARIRVAGPVENGAAPGIARAIGPAESEPVGLPLELVLEAVAEGAEDREVVLRLLLNGAPLPDAQIDLRRLDDGGLESKGTTDAEGRLRIALGPGSWVATSVHLDPSRPATADWESVWSSLTFQLE
jgi:uncharacterized GH25 family protein